MKNLFGTSMRVWFRVDYQKTYLVLMRYLISSILLVVCAGTALGQSQNCLERDSEAHFSFTKDSISIPIEDGVLHATLYLPEGEGPFPAAIAMHGGGNNYERLMNVPLYFAGRAAGCGIITLIYDKRGTGRSTLDYSSADFNDFVSDASAAIDYLNSHSKVDTNHIAAFGVSQGGRLVGVLAARNPKVDMIANVSGPINSVVMTRKFSTLNGIRGSNASEELLNKITPLWESHFDLLEAGDNEGLSALDGEITDLRNEYNPNWLPPLSDEVGNHPIENSYGMNFFDEYVTIDIPWINIYGEDDRAVDAKTSIQNLEWIRSQSGTTKMEIILLPNSTHGLFDTVEQKQYPFDDEVVKWILLNLKNRSDG
ncbi:MAG: alpha/beta hydrolase [bacterium]|nr:alpha/beta hydrolase [bacterium]